MNKASKRARGRLRTKIRHIRKHGAPTHCSECQRKLPETVLRYVSSEHGIEFHCPNCVALLNREGTKLAKFEMGHRVRGVLAKQLVKRARRFLNMTGCKCQACKETFPVDVLTEHHVIPKAAAPQFKGNGSPMIVLCLTCHALEHRYFWPRCSTLLEGVCRAAKPWVRPGERSGLWPHPAWTDAAA